MKWAEQFDMVIGVPVLVNFGHLFANIQELQVETSAWSSDVNSSQRGVDWQMKIDDARCKLKSVYPRIKV